MERLGGPRSYCVCETMCIRDGRLTAALNSVLIRPTDTEGLFWLMVGGAINYDEVLSSREALINAVREGTKRNDINFGDMKYTVDYKYVHAEAYLRDA